MAEQPESTAPPLVDEIHRMVADTIGSTDEAAGLTNALMELLQERGHYLPGLPPAVQILADAKSFAERLTLSNLALRILNMLAWSKVETPETPAARRWLDDYLEGRNHGPVGLPMLWPARLPGMAALLRKWGFEPTSTMPPFVARALPPPGAAEPIVPTMQ